MSSNLFGKALSGFVLKIFGAVLSFSFNLLLARFLGAESTGFFSFAYDYHDRSHFF
jgi:O-antigen/teichoic acid export membrane protein